MKVKLTTGQLEFELESDDVKDLWKELSEIQELFTEKCCGACGSENIVFRVRTVDSNDFYEKTCRECFSSRGFGQKKKNNKLFPKRKDKNGEYLPNNGWVKFARVRDDNDEEPTVEPPKTESKPAVAKKATPKKKAEDEEEAPF